MSKIIKNYLLFTLVLVYSCRTTNLKDNNLGLKEYSLDKKWMRLDQNEVEDFFTPEIMDFVEVQPYDFPENHLVFDKEGHRMSPYYLYAIVWNERLWSGSLSYKRSFFIDSINVSSPISKISQIQATSLELFSKYKNKPLDKAFYNKLDSTSNNLKRKFESSIQNQFLLKTIASQKWIEDKETYLKNKKLLVLSFWNPFSPESERQIQKVLTLKEMYEKKGVGFMGLKFKDELKKTYSDRLSISSNYPIIQLPDERKTIWPGDDSGKLKNFLLESELCYIKIFPLHLIIDTETNKIIYVSNTPTLDIIRNIDEELKKLLNKKYR